MLSHKFITQQSIVSQNRSKRHQNIYYRNIIPCATSHQIIHNVVKSLCHQRIYCTINHQIIRTINHQISCHYCTDQCLLASCKIIHQSRRHCDIQYIFILIYNCKIQCALVLIHQIIHTFKNSLSHQNTGNCGIQYAISPKRYTPNYISLLHSIHQCSKI